MPVSSNSQIVLVLAPVGRDAAATQKLVASTGIDSERCGDLGILADRLDDDVLAVVVAEEALYGRDLSRLCDVVSAQAPWSDLGFIVLTNRNEGPKFSDFRLRLVDRLRNVSFLERPLQAITLQVAVKSAVRARRRQYQARSYLLAQRDAAVDLERLVSDRTIELQRANAQLSEEIERNKQAQAALLQAQKIESIGQLVGGVAHDFNNLLMAIIGNLELLSKNLGDDSRKSRLLNGALEGARRGATLTQRLLAFARKQELQARATNAAELIDDMRGLIERSLGPLVRTEVVASRRLPLVRVDPNQLEMALLNLAVNARDAMPEGGVFDLTVEAVELDGRSDPALSAGEYLRLTVRDTGCGMSSETLARAVEPFFSTKGVGKGTGLGLSMVHGLAEQSGGAFRLASREGEGTTAILWLPVSDDAAQTRPAEVATMKSVAPATILLVDDDALIAASTTALLEDLGHTVIDVNSGDEALRALDDGLYPDLIITDHAMPGMTGTQLAAKIRRRALEIPILLATGYAEIQGDDGNDLPRLAKPYTQGQLSAEIGRILPSASRRAQPATT